MPINPITPAELKTLISCDFETGKLFWLPRPIESFKNKRCGNTWNARYAGHEAFTASDRNGYKVGAIYGTRYSAHRVIFALKTGAWPPNDIDHINCDPADNRWENLRAATRSQNQCNRRSSAGSSSKYLGVCFAADMGKWMASIKIGKRGHHLGYFDNEIEAAKAYDLAAVSTRGAFARPNFPVVPHVA